MAERDGETLAEAFWGVAHQLRRITKDALAPWDVNPSLGRALSVLARHGRMRLHDLAQHLRIAARSTTEVVDALEDRALVTRSPDPDDRRATLVELTDAGRELHRKIHNTRSAEADAFFDTLSPTDRAHLSRILHKLAPARESGEHRHKPA